jgi:putative transposase
MPPNHLKANPMPRQPRLVFPGLPHHVTQRGNYRQNVFESPSDFRKYSYWMAEYAQKYNVKIIAYCLMNNHVHFIVIPSNDDDLAKLFKVVHARYSYYKNQSQTRIGHLWQGRFYSNVLDDVYLLKAVRYVERNPCRAGLVKNPWEYIWSSSREHVGLGKDQIINVFDFSKILNPIDAKSWKKYIEIDDPQMTENFRKKVFKCSVIGTEDFITSLEQKTGRCLKKKKMGRPRNK